MTELDPLQKTLAHGLRQMGLELEESVQARLIAYIRLFEKWNKAYNLSAVRNVNDMVNRHLLDSLSILNHIKGQRLIDVGTGGGLPGIPLAICRPDTKVDLLDSNGKKTRFLFQVKTTLGLDNVEVLNCRVESHQPTELYDGVVSRAFASLEDMTSGCRHLLKPEGRFWAMKGIYPTDELKPLEKHYMVASCHELMIPGEEGQRHLLEITARHP